MYNGFGFYVRGTISYEFVRKNKKSEHWLDHEGLQALFFAVKIHHHHLLKVAKVVKFGCGWVFQWLDIDSAKSFVCV